MSPITYINHPTFHNKIKNKHNFYFKFKISIDPVLASNVTEVTHHCNIIFCSR